MDASLAKNSPKTGTDSISSPLESNRYPQTLIDKAEDNVTPLIQYWILLEVSDEEGTESINCQ